MKKLLLIGYGNMGSAIENAIQNNFEITIVDPNKGYKEPDTFKDFDIILLAIKPQILSNYLEEKRVKFDLEKTIIISIVAGIELSLYKSKLGDSVKIIRVMPNLPSQIKRGVSAILNDIEGVASEIFSKVGTVVEVEKEDDLHLVTAASGSSPAFVFLFIESLIRSVVNQGLDEKQAKELVANTVIGSAEYSLNTDKTMEELIDMVCSKKGTTIEGVEYLKTHKFENIIDEAAKQVVKRSIELSSL